MYLFFDEIQNAPRWESYVRRVHDTEDVQIFLTGSSSHLLARELATSLRGRTISYEVFPLSFAEFLRFRGLQHEPCSVRSEARMAAALEEYLAVGGLPEVVLACVGLLVCAEPVDGETSFGELHGFRRQSNPGPSPQYASSIGEGLRPAFPGHAHVWPTGARRARETCARGAPGHPGDRCLASPAGGSGLIRSIGPLMARYWRLTVKLKIRSRRRTRASRGDAGHNNRRSVSAVAPFGHGVNVRLSGACPGHPCPDCCTLDPAWRRLPPEKMLPPQTGFSTSGAQ